MSKQTFLYLLLVGFGSLLYGQKFTISGYVSDAESAEKLIGAQVFDPVQKAGAITNSYGFYSVTLPADTVKLITKYVGYKTYVTAFVLTKDTTINIDLDVQDVEVEGVEIVADEQVKIQESSDMSSIELSIEQIKSLPALMGEPDVIKAIQLLPGVQSGSEGSSGLYVRGGGPDQNLILLDGVPVYNVTHLFGFFSVFNPSSIRRVNLVKGGFPARYGGRLSSVLDISMKEGNMEEFHGEASIGLISAKAMVEGPIKKGKTSYVVSGRRTYIDALTAPIVAANSPDGSTGGYYFYDLNAKINHKFSDKDRLYLSLYNGKDQVYVRLRDSYTDNGVNFEEKNDFGLGWGNTIAALRWNHLFSDKLFANFTATFSDFDFSLGAEIEERATGGSSPDDFYLKVDYGSGVRDWGGKVDFDYFATPNHLIRFGGYATAHKFNPGLTEIKFEIPSNQLDTSIGNPAISSGEYAVYIEDDIKLGSRIKTNIGVHASALTVNDEFFYSVQPRFSGRYLINENWAFKSSFASMQQYIHLLSNANVGMPTDLWLPATNRVPPQRSLQGAIGIARTFTELGVDFTLEGYYKTMDGLIEYKEGATFFDVNESWEDLVTTGKGESYGAEVLFHKKKGKTNGWIGYTLSWTNRQFEEINDGIKYPYKYDRRHDISVVVNHAFNDRIELSGTWVYGTGNALTIPHATYLGSEVSPITTFGGLFPTSLYGSRNSFRMRSYHRMDIGARFMKQKKKFKRTWFAGIYNVYSRQNPFFVYFANDDNGDPEFRQVSLFPFIPSFSYKIEW